MKTFFKLLFVPSIFLAFNFISCSDNATEPINESPKEYFPNKNGSTYTYDLEITDSLGNVVTGERTSTYSNSTSMNSKTYQILVDGFSFSSYSITDSSYFRKTDTQIFYFTDNSQALMFVPDSVRNLVVVDEEAGLLKFPLNVGTTWPVYKLAINYGVFLFNVISVTANVESVENITLTVNNTSFNKEAVKLKFQMAISLDITSAPLIFTAEAWMVDGVGLVKLEGNSEAINFMIGNNMFYPGGHIKQTLKQYSIP
jgi:hypothetical protein